MKDFLRPSSLGKLRECIHYRGDQFQVEKNIYALRGIKIDGYYPKFISGEGIGTWKMEETADVAAAEWVAEQVKSLLKDVECQKKLQLWDLFCIPNELIMEGTADIVGRNKEDEMLEVWDVKSGRERDYSAQLMCYALMLMDQTQEVECRIRIAYCDLKRLDDISALCGRHGSEKIVSRADCEELVFGIIERVRLGTEPPRENEYCNQCKLQPTCEVWVRPAELAMGVIDTAMIDMSPAFDPALSPQSRLELIKQDPVMLGRFIDCWRKAEKLVEKAGVEDYAKELLIAGKEVPGWRAQENEGRAFYNKEQIEKILAEWGEGAADFLAINRERYEGACSNSDQDYLEPEGRSKSFYKLLRKK